MRMAVIMLCAAAPLSANLDKSKIAKEDSQNVEVDLEVHYHGRNMTDLNVNREGKFQVTFGAVNFKVRNTQGTDGGWSACSATRRSAKKRERTCTEPAPANGGAQCSGSNEDIVDCGHDLPDCVTDGGWSDWSEFSSCSATCGSATKKRERTFTEPAPANGGTQCPGSNEDIVDCDLPDCVSTCGGGATLLSTSPGLDMMVCKDMTQSTCEKDFESLCPAGWNLCHPNQFNKWNTDWDYNWKDADAGQPIGAVYWYGTRGQYPVLNTDVQLFCWWDSSRPGCEEYAGSSPGSECDQKCK